MDTSKLETFFHEKLLLDKNAFCLERYNKGYNQIVKELCDIVADMMVDYTLDLLKTQPPYRIMMEMDINPAELGEILNIMRKTQNFS